MELKGDESCAHSLEILRSSGTAAVTAKRQLLAQLIVLHQQIFIPMSTAMRPLLVKIILTLNYQIHHMEVVEVTTTLLGG